MSSGTAARVLLACVVSACAAISYDIFICQFSNSLKRISFNGWLAGGNVNKNTRVAQQTCDMHMFSPALVPHPDTENSYRTNAIKNKTNTR